MTMLRLDIIRTDGGSQPREHQSPEHVLELVDALARGDTLPPVIVFHDGTDYWLADGFHRHEAHRRLGREEIDAEIKKGTRRDAILYGCGANAAHGLKRSSADKRRAIEALLHDVQDGCLPGHHKCSNRPTEERCWSTWSDREIARQCRVDHKTVAAYRPPYLGNSPDSVRVVKRSGTIYSQKTANIGKTARRTIDRSVSQDEYPDDMAGPAAPMPPPRPVLSEPTSPRAIRFDDEDIGNEVFEFVDALCSKVKANLAHLKPHLGYFIALARAFPPDMTFAEVLRLFEKRAAELSIPLDE